MCRIDKDDDAVVTVGVRGRRDAPKEKKIE
jgi:hypothetical protein